MAVYRCSNCGYKTRKNSLPESCNYCSKKESMKEIEDADRILEGIN